MNTSMLEKVSDENLRELSQMADECWHSAYDELLGKDAVDYMLEKFQSVQALRDQIEKENYIYFYLTQQGEKVGYCGLALQNENLFLSKLYLKEQMRGKGLGGKALGEVIGFARKVGAKRVYLTVNKKNERAIRAYRKFGFTKYGEGVADIGEGYEMDDYYFEFLL